MITLSVAITSPYQHAILVEEIVIMVIMVTLVTDLGFSIPYWPV